MTVLRCFRRQVGSLFPACAAASLLFWPFSPCLSAASRIGNLVSPFLISRICRQAAHLASFKFLIQRRRALHVSGQGRWNSAVFFPDFFHHALSHEILQLLISPQA